LSSPGIFAQIIEYGEGSSITTLGDVYSLGILLLEIFTGRSPTDDTFRGSIDPHKFSEDAFPDKFWERDNTIRQCGCTQKPLIEL
jgi:serine/threonine protein kinase